MDTIENTKLSGQLAQRAAGKAQLGCASVDGRTRLRRLYQDGSAKIRLPAVSAGPLEAVLINTAGGLTGGDRLGWDVDVGADASAAVTTQACEKVYRAASDHAEVRVKLTVGENGSIAWLPQETIVFDRAAFARTLDVELAAGAEALVLEAAVFGRLAMGERAAQGTFRDRWRIRRQGALIHAEDFRIGPAIADTLARTAISGGAIAVATLLLVSPRAEALLDAVREIIGDRGGASVWTVTTSGKLLARLYAEDGYQLRQRLVPLVGLLNGRAGLPKLWSL
ncbi:urease accessory protein UreD [Mesorhizobium sp. M00.F.Ca.ET.151.01.1.1]|uniref:urease accessory protein UreD n=1 Tax=Mesorhizobium sp. M8A.F.Ca.ET.207.01.1.1 TaxID=2563968 RepID=UPI00109C832B|nr:urease accessory protein UreD [Mesorhizobium sp. M8A.F.Ca.ET.207.01.1.1]TGQ81252.1 urease accessory protein UreD [Mesorhizobium sp. M8A.F.Ca.ET.207.01.1.1]TGU94831.1 urease accessory protein UreD [Mesorhizobium sp. M00.F.Ca.ET.151.01.1.1]